jgi:hypothetical protein
LAFFYDNESTDYKKVTIFTLITFNFGDFFLLILMVILLIGNSFSIILFITVQILLVGEAVLWVLWGVNLMGGKRG